MAEGMLDCVVCGTRKWQTFEGTKAEELRLAGATRLPCSVCRADTYWTFSQNERRQSQDRRKEPVAPRPPELNFPIVALKPPPDKEFYRQAAIQAFQTERRTGVDRRQEVQRNHHRLPLQLPIRVRVQSFNLQFEEVTNTVNVCRTGVFFYSPRPYSKGVRAFITLNYVQHDPIPNLEHSGTVVRVESNPRSESKGVAIQLY